MAQQQGGGGGGSMWGALIEGIFGSVEQSQQLQQSQADLEAQQFFQPGAYTQQSNFQDLIVFGALIVLLIVILLFVK